MEAWGTDLWIPAHSLFSSHPEFLFSVRSLTSQVRTTGLGPSSVHLLWKQLSVVHTWLRDAYTRCSVCPEKKRIREEGPSRPWEWTQHSQARNFRVPETEKGGNTGSSWPGKFLTPWEEHSQMKARLESYKAHDRHTSSPCPRGTVVVNSQSVWPSVLLDKVDLILPLHNLVCEPKIGCFWKHNQSLQHLQYPTVGCCYYSQRVEERANISI